jgi:hypothetical protein
MAVRDRSEEHKRAREAQETLRMRMSEISASFKSESMASRIRAMDAWGAAAIEKPGSAEVLSHMPGIVNNFNSTNPKVMASALGAWRVAAKTNPGNQEILQHLRAVAERLSDPDELVRYEANAAWEAAAKANPGHPFVEESRALWDAAQERRR